MDNTTTEQKPLTDDEILSAFDADSKARAKERDEAIKASDVAAIKELTKLRAANPGVEFVILGDNSGGPFRGVFEAPSPEAWSGFQREARSENQRPLAGRNLVVRCLRWPAPTELEAANKRKPGLYNVLSNALVIEAGSGVEANVKK